MLSNFPLENEEGQGLVEYSLILLLVALVAVGALALVGAAVVGFFETAPDWFSTG